MKTQSILQKLTNSGSALLLAGLFCAGVSSVHAGIITAESNSAPARDTNFDGVGDDFRAGTTSHYVGQWDGVAAYHMVYAFQMTGFATGGEITGADFTENMVGTIFGNAGLFDVDVHAIRTAGTSGLLASDYQNTASLLMADFDGGAPGTAGVKSLSTSGQDNLVAYLQANWVENDYVFLGLKTNPLIVTSGTGIYDFDKTTSATLTVVPEPGTYALLAGLTGLVSVMLRRRR